MMSNLAKRLSVTEAKKLPYIGLPKSLYVHPD